MSHIDPRLCAFISSCDAVASAMKLQRSSLSKRLFNDGKRLDSLADGKSDIGIGRLARAEEELREIIRAGKEQIARLDAAASNIGAAA